MECLQDGNEAALNLPGCDLLKERNNNNTGYHAANFSDSLNIQGYVMLV